MSLVLFLRRGYTSTKFKPSNFAIIRFLCMSRNGTNNYASSTSPASGSLVVPSQYSVRELPHGHPPEPNPPKEYILDFGLEDYEYVPPKELFEKYYSAWREYISQSKSGHQLSLPLSKILLRRLHEYMDDSPNKFGKFMFNHCNYEPSVDGPIAVLDAFRYFSLKDRNISFFNKFSTPPESHRSSLRNWLITDNEHSMERMCPWTRVEAYIPQPDSIICHLSSPFKADIKKKGKDGGELVLRRFAMSSPSSPPWESIIMAIDKSCGYLVYTGAIEHEHPDGWIVLDSTTNYTTGDVLYYNKDGSFYVLPDAQSGHLEVWSFQNHILSKVAETNAEFDHKSNNNSYNHIHSYLVQSLKGDLILVRRYYVEEEKKEWEEEKSFKTDSFEVFKFNFLLHSWEVVPSLGKEALFVGSNSSFALSSTKYPEVIPDCIYFCDHGGEDMTRAKDNGIFYLKDCTVTTLFGGEECDQAPTWLCPYEWWPQHSQDRWGVGFERDY